jgi:hypothetical protein
MSILAVGNRVKIARPGHEWDGTHGVVQEIVNATQFVVAPTAHGFRGRFMFNADELRLLCNGQIPGHNNTYAFPCVRPANHQGSCNRSFSQPEDHTPSHDCGYAASLTERDVWAYTYTAACDHGVLFEDQRPKDRPYRHPRIA